MIKLTDVTLRDGLQSEKKTISTQDKVSLFHQLLDCGYHRLEITSFSHPKWIPQLADSEAFCEGVFKSKKPFEMELMAFVPNLKGLERALKYPFSWFSFFTAASETFHQKNVNSSVDDGLRDLVLLIKKAHEQKQKCRVYVSTVFGCPYEGKISNDRLREIIKKVKDCGADEIALSDTIGVATPQQVEQVIHLSASLYPLDQTVLHVHNTYGMGLANLATALRLGVFQFDGSTGGIGGCPYAKGATGNMATEEMAYFFERQGQCKKLNWQEITKAILMIEKLGLSTASQIASVMKRGGALYGIS